MMTLKEKVVQIRKDLKAEGITPKRVSVRGKYALYDESITIKIKDITVSKKLVESIVNKYEEIRYDEYNGEVLAGGNTYIHIEFDWEVLEQAKVEFMDLATEIYNNSQEYGEGSLYNAIEDDRNVVLYASKYNNGNPPTISLNQRPANYKELGCYCYDNVKRYIATTPEGIASALVDFKYQYGLNI